MISDIILASNSPRRKELLSKLTCNFSVIPAVSEERSDAKDPCIFVVELAKQKAREVFCSHPDSLVIGCDTVVDLNGRILGKPSDKKEAENMLKSLSGQTHFVHTGACVLFAEKEISFCETTAVTFRKLTDEEIGRYVQSGAPMDKAGAYGIQECGFVEKYSGSHDNVVGFPTERIAEILENLYKG